MKSNFHIRFATLEDIPAIRHLAYTTWPHAYGSILSADQLDYMLARIYSPESLQEQIKSGHIFLLAFEQEKPLGFAAYSPLPEQGQYKLQKLYVSPETQGSGLGSALLNHVKKEVLALGGKALLLNVNRHNSARNFYEKSGFRILQEEDIDIGMNYWMNDFVMILDL